MLHHFGGKDEIVAAEISRVGLGDIELGSLVIKRVGVIEFLRQLFGELRKIAHADAADAFQNGEFDQRHRDAKQFLGE